MANAGTEPKNNPKMALFWVIIVLMIIGLAAVFLTDSEKEESQVKQVKKAGAVDPDNPFPNTQKNKPKATMIKPLPGADKAATTEGEKTQQPQDNGEQQVIMPKKPMQLSPAVKEALLKDK